MPSTLANRAKMSVTSAPGTGTITLASAVQGYQTFNAALGGSATYTVSYLVEDGYSWEVGTGTYTTATKTLTRSVVESSNGGAAISATSSALVTLTALAADIVVSGGPLGTPSSGTLTNCSGLPAGGVTGLAASATTNALNATNISSGTLAVARGGSGATATTGTINNVLSDSPTFTTVVYMPAGSASAPAISRASDTNTGFWFPAADTIAASVNGAEAFRLNSSGNLGLGGNTTPSEKVDVTGNIKASGTVQDGTAIIRPIVSETAKAHNWNGVTTNTTLEWTGIPSWAKRITVMLNGVSLNSSANLLIQVGASSFSTSSYVSTSQWIYGGSSSGYVSSTSGLILAIGNNVVSLGGTYTLFLINANTWVASGTGVWDSDTRYGLHHAGKTPALSGALDRIRINTTSGTDTFDAGTVNIMYD